MIIAGIITAPIAAVVAGPDPERAAKNVHPSTATSPRLPVKLPIRAWAMATIRTAKPPRSISEPAKTNSGTVSSGNGSTPVYIAWASATNGMSMR